MYQEEIINFEKKAIWVSYSPLPSRESLVLFGVAHVRRPKGRLPLLAYCGNYWCYTVLTFFSYAPSRETSCALFGWRTYGGLKAAYRLWHTVAIICATPF